MMSVALVAAIMDVVDSSLLGRPQRVLLLLLPVSQRVLRANATLKSVLKMLSAAPVFVTISGMCG